MHLKRKSKEIIIETGIALFFIIGMSTLFTATDFFEWWHEVSRAHENWEMDELLGVFISLLIAGTVLSIRHGTILNKLSADLAKANTINKKHAEIKSSKDKLAALGQLSSGMAHEISNALQPAIGLGSFVKEGLLKANNQKHATYMCKIIESVKHAQGVIDNVLTYTRQQDIELEPHMAAHLFNRASLMAIEALPEHVNVTVNELPKEYSDKQIMCNQTCFTQIIMNIIKNAGNAVSFEGHVTISCDMTTLTNGSKLPAIAISIKDDGVGIDKEALDKIFDPFYTTKDVSEGTGLGLAIVYRLIKQHKGEISTDSEVGKGTTFTLRFPTILQAKDMEIT